MRLGGLASGMDTDQMVKEMMKAESVKVDRVEADKQILEWKKEALNSLNKDLANFVLDSKKDLGYNSLGRPGNQDWAMNIVSSDESVGTATAGKGAFSGKHTVNVTKLAEGVSGASEPKIDGGNEFKSVAFEFKINGEKVSVSKDDSLKNIAKKINASGAGVQASYDETLEMFFISTEKEGSSSWIKFEAVKNEDESPNTVNSDELDRFLGAINVKLDGVTDPIKAGTEYSGTDGEVTYKGVPNLPIKSNQFEFNGVKFDAKAVGEFTVDVKTDADAIVDKVKGFVENYNKIIEQANTLVKEKQNRNYRPLTAEQREAMSDKEVELWEQKAKSGVARGDMDIERMLSSLRTDLYKNLEGASGKFSNISQIGITTQGYEAGSAGGKLQIDEDKLRKAITKDSDGVMDVLFKTSSKTSDEDKSTKTTDQGLFNRIFDKMTDGMKNLIGKSGPGEHGDLFRKVKSNIMTDFVVKGGRYSGKGSVSDIENDVNSYTKKIEQLRIQLAKKEEMYFAQFAAMEKAMYKANSQGDWLMQQMQTMF